MGTFEQRKIAFTTFGCKLNQADTAMLAALFAERGWRVVGEGDVHADVIVVNTCTVTARSEAKVRQAIRRLARENPQARIAVVGCAAQLNPEAFRDLPNVRWVLGVDTKFELPEKLSEEQIVRVDEEQPDVFAPAVGLFWSRTRAFLKIQDGCRFRCSYCAVPLARGRSRSADIGRVLDQAQALAERGHREIVLTGVDIGSYGLDLRPRRSLAWLLARLLERVPGVRFRLSSVEPTEVTEELLEVAASSDRICPHWHVPLQSGSDRVLRSMRRPYTSKLFRERIEAILARLGRVGLGSDVIVGYPGERDEDFEATVGLVRELPFTYLHVFPYSPRPGTAASQLPDDVPKATKEARSRILRELATEKKRAFLKELVGSIQAVLVERRRRGPELEGLTGNYTRVFFDGPDSLVGQIVPVRITSAENDGLRGEVASPPGLEIAPRNPLAVEQEM